MDRIYAALIILITAVCLLIITVVFLTQKINKFLGGNKAQSTPLTARPTAEQAPPAHIKAVIIAAISAYYNNQAAEGTEFVVRRIKGL